MTSRSSVGNLHQYNSVVLVMDHSSTQAFCGFLNWRAPALIQPHGEGHFDIATSHASVVDSSDQPPTAPSGWIEDEEEEED